MGFEGICWGLDEQSSKWSSVDGNWRHKSCGWIEIYTENSMKCSVFCNYTEHFTEYSTQTSTPDTNHRGFDRVNSKTSDQRLNQPLASGNIHILNHSAQAQRGGPWGRLMLERFLELATTLRIWGLEHSPGFRLCGLNLEKGHLSPQICGFNRQ